METIPLTPIGTFHCVSKYPYDAARQPECAHGNTGHIDLVPGNNFELALRDLAGFSRIWLVYLFHRNTNWKLLVTPPRADRKIGLFATRAPYRPNPIGISCVELVGISGLRVDVGAHDLLDGSPILDIKPYLPYADSFPDAATGWLDEADIPRWEVAFGAEAEAQLSWLETIASTAFRAFLLQQLAERPFDTERKRIRALESEQWEIAYRTWRARYTADDFAHTIAITEIGTGYSKDDLADPEDKYADKSLHREFVMRFPAPRA